MSQSSILPPETAEPLLKKKSGFRLAPVSFPVTLGAMAFAAIVRYQHAGNLRFPVAELAGAAIGVLLVPAFLTAGIYFIARRSGRAANIAFVLLVMFGAAGQAVLAARQSLQGQNAAAIVSLDKAMTQERARRLDELDTKGSIENPRLASEASSKRLEALSTHLEGEEAIAAKAMAEIVKRIGARTAPHAHATAAVVRAGGLSDIRTAKDARQRRDLFDELERTSTAVIAFLDAIDGTVREELAAAGAPQARVDGMTAEIVAGMQKPLLISIRKQDVAFAQAAQRYVGVLIDQEGKWSIAKNGTITFDRSVPRETIALFNHAAEETAAAAERQDQMMRQLTASAPE